MITYINNEKQWRKIVEYLFASLCYSKFTAHSIFYNACHHRHKLHYYHHSLNPQIKDIPPKSTFFPCKGKNKNHSLILWTDYFSVINMCYFLKWKSLFLLNQLPLNVFKDNTVSRISFAKKYFKILCKLFWSKQFSSPSFCGHDSKHWAILWERWRCISDICNSFLMRLVFVLRLLSVVNK